MDDFGNTYQTDEWGYSAEEYGHSTATFGWLDDASLDLAMHYAAPYWACDI